LSASGRWRLLVLPACCVLQLVSAMGCDGGRQKGKVWITYYPDFYRPDLKRVAILPFANRSSAPGAGERISDRVSALLTNNGTYEVYTRAHLGNLLAEGNLAAAGIVDADAAMTIGRLKAVQALICGVCDRYDVHSVDTTATRRIPVYARNLRGKRVIVGWREEPYIITRHEATVECQVVVIDTATGRQVAACSTPSVVTAEGSPPEYSPEQLLRLAEDDQIERIVAALAVTRTQVKLEGQALRTATGEHDGEWDWQKKITPDDGRFAVVVALPPAADRNPLRISIVPEGEHDPVAEQSGLWDGQYERFGYYFDVQPIVQRAGFGQYQAKLYLAAESEPVARYSFQVVPER
jgi:hypothetical protein